MTALKRTYERMIKHMNVKDLEVPLTAVKFYKKGDKIPRVVREYIPEGISLTSCQANKQASLGDAVCLTIDTIGCVAAAITFGLVDPDDEMPLKGPRVYTDIMKDHVADKDSFTPPSPADFTKGNVYSFKDTGNPQFALFGEEDCGRYKNVKTAKKAIGDMMKITPADTQAVFMYAYDFNDKDITPDIVVLSVRPVELTRIIQAYQFLTGERVTSSMGGIRVVNSDLIVRPLLEDKINVSTYCLGARLIAQYEANRLGIGMPYRIFETIAEGMEKSETGYPFQMYPGATDI